MIPTGEKAWCEVWLSSDRDEVIRRFERLLENEEIETVSGFIRFPERTVKVIFANRSDLERLSALSDDIAEYRLAKDTAAFWSEMENHEQADWVRNLLGRIMVNQNTQAVICILDTGINNGHPLLQPVLNDLDCMAVDITWGIVDHNGHGTLMAGIAAYGDLRECLTSSDSIILSHCLESVKILPRPPLENRKDLWGHIISQAVSRSEIQNPDKKRLFCLAVSATDTRDKGSPSSWSAQLDQLSSGAIDDIQRLFVVNAGNITDLTMALRYPAAQLTDSVHDPAQAWNALTVGAYTRLSEIRDPTLRDYVPVAQSGQISPFTTTSLTWDNQWPIKPEIVMEGGNLAHDNQGFVSECDDLSLLSTFRDPSLRYFYSFNMTSAAVAQAAWLSAKIQNYYPEAWPERYVL